MKGAPAVLLGLLAACRPPGPQAAFERDVLPVLEASCSTSTCHAVEPGEERNGHVVDWSLFYFRVDATGQIKDPDAAYRAAKRIINTVEEPRVSSILRKPLGSTWGGLPHFGGDNFISPDDPDLKAVAHWISLESEGGEDPHPLSVLETQFADDVQPLLASMGCSGGGCHGLDSAVPYRLDAGMDGRFHIEATRANYAATRAMLSRSGAPLQSRILRKSLPLWSGGILHKGGNVSFLRDEDDPRIEPILEWVCAEREATGAGPSVQPGAPSIDAIVFVRGPGELNDPFELDVYTPGTDLWLAPVSGQDLTPTDERCLTCDLHDGAGDARDPAVSPDGRQVAFALRTGPEEGHRIYLLELATGAIEPLTTGGHGTDRDPAWGPDDMIWFASTRSGFVSDGGLRIDSDLYTVAPDSRTVQRRSWTPHMERLPTFYVVGDEAGGEMGFTALRQTIPEAARAHGFRMPPGLDTEYHQHFGVTIPETLTFDTRELADGRYVAVLGELGQAWEGGRLGIIDRNFGPEAPADAVEEDVLALPLYAAPLRRLGEEGAHRYRDPAGLPDGRILVARANPPSGPFDAAPSLDLGIVLVALHEGSDGSGPQMASSTILLDRPGVAEFDPEPIVSLPSYERHAAPAWSPDADTATLLHNGVPMVDALLGSLPPVGSREAREDISGVRLVESIPLDPTQRQPVPSHETRYGIEGATSTGLGPHGPTRILAELELAPDGSFQAEVPAGIAVRVQPLDDWGMSVGTPHNRWIDFAPGQVVRQGISHQDPGHYATRCAACHGALDGDPDNVFVTPDVMTTASLTLSRYESGHPRRPLPAPVLGEDTRRTVSFQRDLQPLLVDTCARCHSGEDPPAGLSLTAEPTTWYSDAYESLLAPGDRSGSGRAWVDDSDASARQSYLMEVLTGEELDAPGALPDPGSAHPADMGGESLHDHELALLVRWIELGATYLGDAP